VIWACYDSDFLGCPERENSVTGVYIRESERKEVKSHRSQSSRTRFVPEALISLNTAFATISKIFCASSSASLPFVHLELYLNHLLGIRQTDYIRGYFTIWIPTLVLALSLLMLSRYLIARYITGFALHAQAAMAILLSPVAVWTCRYEQNGWSLQWPYKTIWGEAALASICVGIFLMAPWEISRKMGLSALLGHCVFWYWFVSDGFHLPNSLNWEMPGL
jgi:hypothetical protein